MEQSLIKYLIIGYVINYIIYLIRKKYFGLTFNELYCGLFGFSGNTKPNIEKIKILGLYNETRGPHSCGYYYNDLLIRGVDKLKLFHDLIQEEIIDNEDGGNHIFIGHTRKSTMGTHTIENAHPFMIENEDRTGIVLAHNGIIKNIKELCEAHKVEYSASEVDSFGLAKIINKDGFDVLKEYKGFAALLIHSFDEPNSLYVYHGASKDKKDGGLMEERPMYYMITNEGIYFSSMEEALLSIRETEKEIPKELSHNYVYKFTNGSFTNKKIAIEREEMNIEVEVKPVTQIYHYPTPSKHYKDSVEHFYSEGLSKLRPTIWDETIPSRIFQSHEVIYYRMGRYFDIHKDLLNGTYWINKKGEKSDFIDKKAKLYCFYRGVLLKGQKEYDELVEIETDKANKEHEEFKEYKYNFALIVSKYSRYPVTNLPNEGELVNAEWRYKWFSEGQVANLTFTPKWSNRTYTINNGVFSKVLCSDANEKPLIYNLKDETPTVTVVQSPKSDCCNIPDKPVEQAKLFDMNGQEIRQRSCIEQIIKQMAQEREENLYDADVAAVAKKLRSNYYTIPEVFAEAGSTALLAIELYVHDFYEKDLGLNVSEADMPAAVELYIEQCVNDGITLEDGMSTSKWVLPLGDYIKKAIALESTDSKPVYDKEEDITDVEYTEVIERMEREEQQEDFKDLEKWKAVEEDEQFSEANKVVEDSNAKYKINDLISSLIGIESIAQDLTMLNASDLAQDTAYEIFKILDLAKVKLKNVGIEHNMPELVDEITKSSVI